MESIYWVVSRNCNQRCPHCYNDSQPGAGGLTPDEVSTCVNHLPDPKEVTVERIILSGGEVLVWPELLFDTLAALRNRYEDKTDLWIQTNGDLLDEKMLDRLLDHKVVRIDVASMDSYHPGSTLRRRDGLTHLFRSYGMIESRPDLGREDVPVPSPDKPVFAFWGATEEQWIGPLWPRGRAHRNNLSKAGFDHDFCGNWSGAKNFLNYRSHGCEINLQLADVYPCCPMTCRPIGNLLTEPLTDILDRSAKHPVYQALNAGRPHAMGESLGITEQQGARRSRELGNHCLWCDEFFTKHAPDLLEPAGRTARATVDLAFSGNR